MRWLSKADLDSIMSQLRSSIMIGACSSATSVTMSEVERFSRLHKPCLLLHSLNRVRGRVMSQCWWKSK